MMEVAISESGNFEKRLTFHLGHSGQGFGLCFLFWVFGIDPQNCVLSVSSLLFKLTSLPNIWVGQSGFGTHLVATIEPVLDRFFCPDN
jgi:cellobiose-specific phosphotransferase system component IIC